MGIQGDQWIRRHEVTVDQYHRMGETGVLSSHDRVELVEGEIIDMAPIGSRHAGHVRKLTKLLSAAVGEAAQVSVQNPVQLGLKSEPKPDIALLRPQPDFYTERHPSASDVLLIIEVAETSQRYDREVKLPLYAQQGIPEVWIVDTENKSVSIYRSPTADGYLQHESLGQPGMVTVSALPAVSVDLSTLL